MTVILDASALLAYLHHEKGWEIVRTTMAESAISAVNWSEVAQKIERKGLAVDKARGFLDELGLAIASFSADQAEQAARLWEKTHQKGLSLADRACLALAMERNVPVLTADRAWGELDLPVEIRLVR